MLPLPALLALTTTVFLGCLTEVLPAGLLLGMSEELGVSPSATGQLVTVYAITTALTAVPLTGATLRVPRKRLLLVLIFGFLATNLVIAVSSSYPLILATRVVSGALTGVMWSLVAGYAMRLAPAGLTGRALAVAMSGTPIGFALGVPAGTALGEFADWRWAFAAMALISVPLLAWVSVAVPAVPAERTEPTRPLAASRLPGMRPVLATVALFSLGHNVAYTYIGPVFAGLGVERMLGAALLVFGCATVGGLVAVGSALDSRPRAVLLSCSVATAAAIVLMGISDGVHGLVLAAAALWGLGFGGAPTAFQAVTAVLAGPTADAAQSLTIAAWNGAVAGGALVGGLLLPLGTSSLPWCAAFLILVPLLFSRRVVLSAPADRCRSRR
ncbi:MFS transporter [Amycolatopsis keratiniphila]|uniref:MFS transporter n=1 Tax=Amycolatopsis keratiniphila subsp. keratiniphila TaxID=227715 RepID=A0A1W2M4A0_9PSEU|nr:MFS transporter [Amycolatopsis keratiniphila]OLZ52224.1 MFS transporter [Amycolatopsis keratiniphila subsp. nogabecina]ONF75149.1 MFS transporter [Amycolatopsis keratiniphila subsp. keratiniphila]SDU60025.1 Predicted arabinose efflux permease, MFS family [Amycolatopsis keratiniphila]